jgi:hypothetical protein
MARGWQRPQFVQAGGHVPRAWRTKPKNDLGSNGLAALQRWDLAVRHGYPGDVMPASAEMAKGKTPTRRGRAKRKSGPSRSLS